MTGMLFMSNHASEIHFILFARQELCRLWIFRGIDLIWANSCCLSSDTPHKETKKYM